MTEPASVAAPQPIIPIPKRAPSSAPLGVALNSLSALQDG